MKGGLFSIYSFINQGISFFLLVILAKFIMPDDYGKLSLFNTILMVLGYIMAFSTAGYISVSFFKKGEIEFRRDFSAVISLGLFSFLSLLAITTLLIKFSNIDFGFPPYLLWVGVTMSFCNMIINILLDYNRIRERLVNYGWISCSSALLNFGLALFFVITLKHGWLGKVESQLICAICFSIYGIKYFWREGLFDFDFLGQRFKMLLLWGLPIIPHLATGFIRQGCDRYIINFYHTTYDVGLFSFALNLTNVIIMIGMAFNQTNSVGIYQILSSTVSHEIKRQSLFKRSKQIFYIYIAATLCVVVLMGGLIPVLIPNYSESLPYFFMLSVYGFLQCIYFLFCNYLFYYEQTRHLMYITFFTSVLHLCLSLILTRYSLYATCALYTLTQGIVTILVMRKTLVLLKLKLNSYEDEKNVQKSVQL